MCNNIYWRFRECGHRELQNTFPCHIARRCQPGEDMLLARGPVNLPILPRIPIGLLDCRQRTLIKGRAGWCPDCQSAREWEAREQARRLAGSSSSETLVDGGPLDREKRGRTFSGLRRGPFWRREKAPTPDKEAIELVQKSFERISMLQPCSPEPASQDEQNGEGPPNSPGRRATK